MQGSFLKNVRIGRVQVKICGFTRPENVREAAALSADAFGFVLFRKSRRFVPEEALEALLAEVPQRITPVLLLVDPAPEQVLRLSKKFPRVMLQFHGSESRALCELSGLPYMKVVHFRQPGDLARAARDYPTASGILADCPAPDAAAAPGGNGAAFDWEAARTEAAGLPLPLVLAGGLNASNASRAVRLLRPAALDVSSGVEKSPGIKDMIEAEQFLVSARSAANLA